MEKIIFKIESIINVSYWILGNLLIGSLDLQSNENQAIDFIEKKFNLYSLSHRYGGNMNGL